MFSVSAARSPASSCVFVDRRAGLRQVRERRRRAGVACGFANSTNVSKNGPVAPSARNQVARRRGHADRFVPADPERLERRSTSRARRCRAARTSRVMPNDWFDQLRVGARVHGEPRQRRESVGPRHRRRAFAQVRDRAPSSRVAADWRAADTSKKKPCEPSAKYHVSGRAGHGLVGVRAVARSRPTASSARPRSAMDVGR